METFWAVYYHFALNYWKTSLFVMFYWISVQIYFYTGNIITNKPVKVLSSKMDLAENRFIS